MWNWLIENSTLVTVTKIQLFFICILLLLEGALNTERNEAPAVLDSINILQYSELYNVRELLFLYLRANIKDDSMSDEKT